MQKVKNNIIELKDNNIISIRNLTCAFNKNNENEIIALKDINLDFEKNKIHCIIGNSGSGKSTLVCHLNGLYKSKKAIINVNNFNILPNKRGIKNVNKLRKIISIVFQHPEYQLFKDTIKKDISFGPIAMDVHTKKEYEYNRLMILEKIMQNRISFNVILSKLNIANSKINFHNFDEHILLKYKFLKNKNIVKITLISKQTKKKYKSFVKYEYKSKEQILHNDVIKYLKIMGLDESYLDRNPFGLSGGQKRRVAIAGILAIEPEILVFDEPTAGLDPKGEQEMMDIILNAKKEGKTIIVITHTIDHVLEIADNIIVLKDGQLYLQGDPYSIFTNPKLLENTNIELPKVIDFIYKLKNKNKKYNKLLELQPRNIDELVKYIEEI